jgi:hypothetical protein
MKLCVLCNETLSNSFFVLDLVLLVHHNIKNRFLNHPISSHSFTPTEHSFIPFLATIIGEIRYALHIGYFVVSAVRECENEMATHSWWFVVLK